MNIKPKQINNSKAGVICFCKIFLDPTSRQSLNFELKDFVRQKIISFII